MNATKLAMLLMLALWPLGSAMAADVEEAPEVIVVTGRLPGPPLWKVSKGENVLWIFPHLEWIPQDMFWDSERVARVIAESQEVLSLPVIDVSYPSQWALNPINLLRHGRLQKRLDRNPDGGTLEENLSPEVYARYAALQARYYPLPAERRYLEMRPEYVGPRMMHIIREREGLVAGGDILKTIARLVRRNRDIERTEISVEVNVEGRYGDYAERLEALAESVTPELEQACFEQQVRHMEDIDGMKRLANSWAEGHIDEFRTNESYSFSLVLGELQACDEMITGSASPERDNMARTTARLNQMWLDAAGKALATNASTFAILPINELLAEDGLLSKLKAMGYEVREP